MSGTAGRTEERASAAGLLLGLGAYTFWGFLAIYFKQVAWAPPVEVLAHRVVWALLLLLVVLWQQGRLGELRRALRPGRTLAMLGATTGRSGRILEGSLGYFINPLVNVLLGVMVLKERLERPVVAAVALAAGGVAWLTVQAGQLP